MCNAGHQNSTESFNIMLEAEHFCVRQAEKHAFDCAISNNNRAKEKLVKMELFLYPKRFTYVKLNFIITEKGIF